MKILYTILLMTPFLLSDSVVNAQDTRRDTSEQDTLNLRQADIDPNDPADAPLNEEEIKKDAMNRIGDEYEMIEYTKADDYIKVVGEKDAREIQVYYEVDGRHLYTIYVTAYSKLPKPVQDSFARSHIVHSDISNVFFIDTEESDYYSIKVRQGGDFRYFIFDEEGKNVDTNKELLFMQALYEDQ